MRYFGDPERITVTALHKTICDGKRFTYAVGSDLNNGEISIISFETGSVEINFWINVSMALKTRVQYFEGGELTDGTLGIGFNRNRTSDITTEAVIKLNPTITTPGIELLDATWGSGRVSGGKFEDNGYVMKPNTVYYMIVTSLANSNTVTPSFDWKDNT